tara:strand:- start:74969 stop:75118 length:150 start_codon:yes stop_codon:yes gene_type:complete
MTETGQHSDNFLVIQPSLKTYQARRDFYIFAITNHTTYTFKLYSKGLLK